MGADVQHDNLGNGRGFDSTIFGLLRAGYPKAAAHACSCRLIGLFVRNLGLHFKTLSIFVDPCPIRVDED